MVDSADREKAEMGQRKVPWQARIIGPILALEPLLDHPDLFGNGRASEEGLRRALEKDHPEAVEYVIERSRKSVEDDGASPFRVNTLTTLYAPALQILWPPKTEATLESDDFRDFCEKWLGDHLTPGERQSLLHRLIGVKAIMDVKKQFKRDKNRPKVKRVEAQRVFDFAKLAVAIIDDYMSRPVDQVEVERLIDRCKQRLSGERKTIFHEKFQELWRRAVATKSVTLVLDQR